MTGAAHAMGGGTVERRIFAAALVVAAMTAACKLVALFKEVMVASLFGTGDELDAFLLAFLLPSFTITVVAGSFGVALVPSYVRALHDKEAAQRLLSGAIAWSLLLLSIATAAVVASAAAYLPAIASGFSAEKLERTKLLLWLLSPVILLRGLSTLFGAVLNATERFAVAALAPTLVSLAVIVALLAVGARFGGGALVAGTVGGMVAEALLLGIALRRRGISIRPRWRALDPDLRRVVTQYLPAVSAAFLLCGTTIIDLSMAAMLGSGSVATLAYAAKLVALPMGLGATALGTAVVPYFSRMLARGDQTGARATLHRYLVLVFAVTIPVTALLVVAAQPLAEWIFERGSFSAEDTCAVSRTLALLVLQIPFHTAGVLVVRLLSAALVNRALLYGNILSLALNVLLNLLFMRELGVAGIALSTSCVYFVSFLFVYAWCRRVLRRSPCA